MCLPPLFIVDAAKKSGNAQNVQQRTVLRWPNEQHAAARTWRNSTRYQPSTHYDQLSPMVMLNVFLISVLGSSYHPGPGAFSELGSTLNRAL